MTEAGAESIKLAIAKQFCIAKIFYQGQFGVIQHAIGDVSAQPSRSGIRGDNAQTPPGARRS
jgi:hypothetical protein